MLLSICTLGQSNGLLEFLDKYKSLSYYKKRDSDTEGVRIHVSYVNDVNLFDKEIAHRYEMADGNYRNVVNDGTQGTKKESTIGNDIDWLLTSNGHDTIVEVSEDPEKYLDTLVALMKKGYDAYITTRIYADKYWKTLENAAEEGGGSLTYCDDIYHVLGCLDDKYQEKLSSHRKNLLEDSYSATPCGLTALS